MPSSRLLAAELGIAVRNAAGYSTHSVAETTLGAAIALLGFYAAGSIFINSYFGRTLLPLGKPLGLIRKGPAK